MLLGTISNSVRVKGVLLCLSLLTLSWTRAQTNADPSNPNAFPGANDANAARVLPVVPVGSAGRAQSAQGAPPLAQPVAPPIIANVVDQACLQCLCLASTGCKAIGCHLAGPNAYYCGAYLVSWAYWADAGKPGDDPANPYAFERCLNNSQCAEQTIQQYMNKYGRDCNGDNRIDCADYARIHKAGPTDCQAPWVETTTYWQTFLTCNPAAGGGRPIQPIQPVRPVVQPVQPVVQPVRPVVQPVRPVVQPVQPVVQPVQPIPDIDVRSGNNQKPIEVKL